MNPKRMQQFLKSAAGLARARVVATELLDQLLVAVDRAFAALDARFGGEALPSLTGGLESSCRRGRGILLARDDGMQSRRPCEP